MGYSSEPRPWLPFLDRNDAGTRLGRALRHPGKDMPGVDSTVVLGLARGGVPVAAAVARAIGRPLGVMVVRKLGVPGSPEVAFGAVATYGGATSTVHLERTIRELRGHGYGLAELEGVDRGERDELARRQGLYVHGTQTPVAGRTVLLCDDGLATGATMRAAVVLMREAGAGVVVVCVPAAPRHSCAELAGDADRVICLQPWPNLRAVSEAYLRFGQVGDAEVLALLAGTGPLPEDSGDPGPLKWQ
ncbi:phosphoribosyl transferase [Arthrobacter livingstonensis]|uniref:Phosphoribosyl transferase n=1 Tax=Arthrobacter livingstonensis TaxID=670078 RepID=A0A2V5LY26_9MICC|nr:phosphoribosyltransferase family protein [Arthrobacter livingstonensis]PYI68737.1 phosphoribosyl transferase [Arthrobacter livingstonensis]